MFCLLPALAWLYLVYAQPDPSAPLTDVPTPMVTRAPSAAPTPTPPELCFSFAVSKTTQSRRLLSDPQVISAEMLALIQKLGIDAGVLSEEALMTAEWAMAVLDMVVAIGSVSELTRQALDIQREINELTAATFTALIDETDSGFSKVAADIDGLAEFTGDTFLNFAEALDYQVRAEAMHSAYTRSVSVYNDEQVALLTPRGVRLRALFRTPNATVDQPPPSILSSRFSLYHCSEGGNAALAVKICNVTSVWAPSFLNILGVRGTVLKSAVSTTECVFARVFTLSGTGLFADLKILSAEIVSYAVALTTLSFPLPASQDSSGCDIIGFQDVSARLKSVPRDTTVPSQESSSAVAIILTGGTGITPNGPTVSRFVDEDPPFDPKYGMDRALELTDVGRELLAWEYDLSLNYGGLGPCSGMDNATVAASLNARRGVRSTWGSGTVAPYSDAFAQFVFSTQGSSLAPPPPLVVKEFHRQRSYFNSSAVRALLADLIAADAEFDAAVSYVDMAADELARRVVAFDNVTRAFADSERQAAVRHNATRDYVDAKAADIAKQIAAIIDPKCDPAVADASIIGVVGTLLVGSGKAFCESDAAARGRRVREASTIMCWSDDFPSSSCIGTYVTGAGVSLLTVAVVVISLQLCTSCGPRPKRPEVMQLY